MVETFYIVRFIDEYFYLKKLELISVEQFNLENIWKYYILILQSIKKLFSLQYLLAINDMIIKQPCQLYLGLRFIYREHV